MRAMPLASGNGIGETWTFIGPQPIKNAQGLNTNGQCGHFPITGSGRVTAIGFGATPTIIYLGSASGGVWQSIHSCTPWPPLTHQQGFVGFVCHALLPRSAPDEDVI